MEWGVAGFVETKDRSLTNRMRILPSRSDTDAVYFIRQRLLQKFNISTLSSIMQRIDQLLGTLLN